MKMKYMIGLIFVACTNPKPTHEFKTTDQEFVNVMADLYIAEQVLRTERATEDSIKGKYRDQVFAIHSITDTFLFNEELRLLMDDKRKYQMINDSVIARLESLGNIKPKTPVEQ